MYNLVYNCMACIADTVLYMASRERLYLSVKGFFVASKELKAEISQRTGLNVATGAEACKVWASVQAVQKHLHIASSTATCGYYDRCD